MTRRVRSVSGCFRRTAACDVGMRPDHGGGCAVGYARRRCVERFATALCACVLLFSLFWLPSCARSVSDSFPGTLLDSVTRSEVAVSQYRVIGPFPLDSQSLPKSLSMSTLVGDSGQQKSPGISVDYLNQAYGVPEPKVTAQAASSFRTTLPNVPP
jgi:hypothetical protein